MKIKSLSFWVVYIKTWLLFNLTCLVYFCSSWLFSIFPRKIHSLDSNPHPVLLCCNAFWASFFSFSSLFEGLMLKLDSFSLSCLFLDIFWELWVFKFKMCLYFSNKASFRCFGIGPEKRRHHGQLSGRVQGFNLSISLMVIFLIIWFIVQPLTNSSNAKNI